MSSQQQGKSKEELDELRCTKYFDALWFCYSPVYQMKQYYVYGTVDDCKGHWSKWFNCLRQKTKFKDEEPKPVVAKHPIWQLRTKEEAQEFWQAEFGHLQQEGEEEGEGDSGASKRRTFF